MIMSKEKVHVYSYSRYVINLDRLNPGVSCNQFSMSKMRLVTKSYRYKVISEIIISTKAQEFFEKMKHVK